MRGRSTSAAPAPYGPGLLAAQESALHQLDPSDADARTTADLHLAPAAKEAVELESTGRIGRPDRKDSQRESHDYGVSGQVRGNDRCPSRGNPVIGLCLLLEAAAHLSQRLRKGKIGICTVAEPADSAEILIEATDVHGWLAGHGSTSVPRPRSAETNGLCKGSTCEGYPNKIFCVFLKNGLVIRVNCGILFMLR
jgi:hypothetical protein